MVDDKYTTFSFPLNSLSSLQYQVTQLCGTEPPFENEYWDFWGEGIYLDRISKCPLFASFHKFDSGSGWPSFVHPINNSEILEKEDFSHGMKRIEVKSVTANSHLGHVFSDGPLGLPRYCINSASLEFVPLTQLEKRGLGHLCSLFSKERCSSLGLGGGCFWGVQALLKKLPGIRRSQVGYWGGDAITANYEQICQGETGHAEVVWVEYYSDILPTESLLRYFLLLHDPTTVNRQGLDQGTQYRSLVVCTDSSQFDLMCELKEKFFKESILKRPCVTEITLSSEEEFFMAEEYHQNYYKKKYSGRLGPVCHALRRHY